MRERTGESTPVLSIHSARLPRVLDLCIPNLSSVLQAATFGKERGELRFFSWFNNISIDESLGKYEVR